jgi:hypothetical protein
MGQIKVGRVALAAELEATFGGAKMKAPTQITFI